MVESLIIIDLHGGCRRLLKETASRFFGINLREISGPGRVNPQTLVFDTVSSPRHPLTPFVKRGRTSDPESTLPNPKQAQAELATISTSVEIWTPYLGAFDHPDTCARKGPQFSKIAEYFIRGRLWHCECTTAIKAIEELSQSLSLPEDTMRSELIFGAMTYVSNRFLLTRLASKATRSFHRPDTRIEETVNEVFERFAHADPLAVASYAGNLQLCPYAAQGETHPFYEDQKQSVA
jgi:hypothetical protein